MQLLSFSELMQFLSFSELMLHVAVNAKAGTPGNKFPDIPNDNPSIARPEFLPKVLIQCL
jgi:hypothetical protein